MPLALCPLPLASDLKTLETWRPHVVSLPLPLALCPMPLASSTFRNKILNTTWLPLLCFGLPSVPYALPCPLPLPLHHLPLVFILLPVSPCHLPKAPFFLQIAFCLLTVGTEPSWLYSKPLSSTLLPPPAQKPTHPTIYLDTRESQICYPDHIWNWR